MIPLTRFILVRHGLSVANVKKIFAGQTDVKLTEIGYKQADCVCKYIYDNFKVDEIYSSDLSRCVETITPLAKALKMEIKTDKGLRETCVGLWEGKTREEIKELFPESYKIFLENVTRVNFEGGDNYATTQKRMVSTIDKIAKENDGKCVVVATHAGVTRQLIGYLKKFKLEDIVNITGIKNASIVIFDYENKEAVSDIKIITEHLEELEKQTEGNII